MTNPGTTNLEAWWELGDVTDSHGSNDLTNSGSVSFPSGKVGNAASFVAANPDYLTIADNASLSTGDIDFTFGCWVNLDLIAANRFVMGKGGSGANSIEYMIIYITGTNRFRFYIASGAAADWEDADELGEPAVGTWYFIVCWHKASTSEIGIQVNNGTADTDTATVNPYDSGEAFWIGERDGEAEYDGLIDEGFFYKRVLTAAEREWLYNSGSGRAYSDIIAVTVTPTPGVATSGEGTPTTTTERIVNLIFGARDTMMNFAKRITSLTLTDRDTMLSFDERVTSLKFKDRDTSLTFGKRKK